MIIHDTPVERYRWKNKIIHVKREDLSCLPPGPPFSKVRGLERHLSLLYSRGVRAVGYVETAVSMAGWGIAWIAQEIGMKAVIFDPQYKKPPSCLILHRQKWKEFGAITIPFKPTRFKIAWYQAKKELASSHPGTVMLPLGIPLEESVEATYEEALKTFEKFTPGSIVSCSGSGTIIAGVLKAAPEVTIRAVSCYQRSIRKKRQDIVRKARIIERGLLGHKVDFWLIGSGYAYTEKEEEPAPFPCNPYYDRKAWAWLMDNYKDLPKPVLFWNVGQ